jgi:hypothetical protein
MYLFMYLCIYVFMYAYSLPNDPIMDVVKGQMISYRYRTGRAAEARSFGQIPVEQREEDERNKLQVSGGLK